MENLTGNQILVQKMSEMILKLWHDIWFSSVLFSVTECHEVQGGFHMWRQVCKCLVFKSEYKRISSRGSLPLCIVLQEPFGMDTAVVYCTYTHIHI
jgi:hypothetical protein